MNLETPETPGPEFPPPPPPPPAAPGPAQALLPEARAPEVERLLAAVRTRQRRLLWAEGALWGGAALGVLALAGGFLGLWAPAAARWVLLLSPVVAAAVACAFGLFLALRTVGDDVRTARLIGERRPELSLDVLAAVELSRQQGPGHSQTLTRAFLGQMDARVRTVRAEAVVDSGRTRRAGLALGALVLVAGVVLALSGAHWRQGALQALRSAQAPEVVARLEPITGDIELTYRYPAYTGLAPRTVAGTNGEVSAPSGTEVVLKTRSDREVERAELIVDGQTLPLQVEGARDLKGSFIARKSGHYHFVFYGSRQKPLAVGPDIPITVEPDAAPQVTILTPAAELEVDPGQKVTLKYEATDDYGLNGLALVFRVPRTSKESRVALPREDGRRDRGTYTWDLGSLKVEPGDRITYFVEARDNDTVEGPKRGVSRTQVLKIYSAAEHRRAALEKAEALWGRMVDHLADRLEGPEREASRDVKKVTAGQSVDASGQQLVGDMRTLGQELSRERDVPTELVGALLNISQSLGSRVTSTADFRRLYLRTQRARGEDWGTGSRLARAVEEEILELEKDILYLESLLDRQKLEALREMAERMASERRELARLIEQYKANPDEAARQQVMEQIEQLKARMAELAQRMAEMRKGIRDEHLNAEALNELMKDQDLSGGLDEVERLMREGKTDEALAKLQELGQQMDEMLGNLDKAQDEFGAEQYPELAEKFGGFMKELEATATEQQRAAEQTRQLRDQARSRNRDQLTQRGQAMKDELLRQVEAVQKSYEELDPDALNSRAARPMEEAQAELENLKSALKVDDFDLASEAARRADEAARQLAMLGEQQRQLDEMFGNPDEVRQQSSQLAQRLERDARQMEDVHRKLESLFPPPGAQMTPQERQQLQQLAQQQQQLEQRAQGLRQQMEEMEQMAPLFGPRAAEQMDQVGQRMGEAAQRMQGRDPGRGYGEQQAALEGLRQFQQQMKEGQRNRGSGRGGLPLPMGMGGRREGNGRNPQDKVELPDEDAFQAPKEFRKDLLDAMKEGAPEKYQEQVKRYYEELVK